MLIIGNDDVISKIIEYLNHKGTMCVCLVNKKHWEWGQREIHKRYFLSFWGYERPYYLNLPPIVSVKLFDFPGLRKWYRSVFLESGNELSSSLSLSTGLEPDKFLLSSELIYAVNMIDRIERFYVFARGFRSNSRGIYHSLRYSKPFVGKEEDNRMIKYVLPNINVSWESFYEFHNLISHSMHYVLSSSSSSSSSPPASPSSPSSTILLRFAEYYLYYMANRYFSHLLGDKNWEDMHDCVTIESIEDQTTSNNNNHNHNNDWNMCLFILSLSKITQYKDFKFPKEFAYIPDVLNDEAIEYLLSLTWIGGWTAEGNGNQQKLIPPCKIERSSIPSLDTPDQLRFNVHRGDRLVIEIHCTT
eukprot:TRINITY_DN3567_c0_g1_i2.p1 TRINITY_DN3567_c0_g1~~TRINITY_DN3567_c0_g1_i2.p1  ORF type:complete len:359 (+),score=67.68 TRINITY_DN3567_c0_g1_i2:17-1093(+)